MTRQIPQGDYFVSTSNGGTIKRIRQPHPHDVLCGRGGGINSHIGNRVFREWVSHRRLDYNLAASKADKARVANEVMAQVSTQNPPGRFLQRDPTGGIGSWWIEIDEIKAMAKTSQALREGAPSIRAQHGKNPPATTSCEPRGTKRTRTLAETTNETRAPNTVLVVDPPTPPLSSVPAPLMSNTQFVQEFEKQFGASMPPAKQLKMTAPPNAVVTPNLDPVAAEMDPDAIPPLYLEPTRKSSSTSTTTIEMLKDFDWTFGSGKELQLGDFVNPFENEEERLKPFFSAKKCVQCGGACDQTKDMCNSCIVQMDPLHQIDTVVSI